jgi:DNA repair ATPase RecN
MMHIDENLQGLIDKLDDKINKLEEIYTDITKKLEVLNGEDNIWKGTAQAKLYEYLVEMEKEFPVTISDYRKYKDFLQTTLDNYKKGEETHEKAVEDSSDNLDVNE